MSPVGLSNMETLSCHALLRAQRACSVLCVQVEMVFTKFASLISSDPIVQTVLPLTPAGEVCDINGNCVVRAIYKLGSSTVASNSGHALHMGRNIAFLPRDRISEFPASFEFGNSRLGLSSLPHLFGVQCRTLMRMSSSSSQQRAASLTSSAKRCSNLNSSDRLDLFKSSPL